MGLKVEMRGDGGIYFARECGDGFFRAARDEPIAMAPVPSTNRPRRLPRTSP